MASDADLLNQLETHISNVQQDPATPLNEKLFESSKTFLAPNVAPDTSTRLVQQLAGLVTTLQQDPTPINDLLLRLLEPYSFSDILSFEFPVDFVAGLDVAAQPFNLLTLSLLEKATATSNDAATLATKPAVVLAIVRLWLCTPDTGVADKAQNVLLGLLKADEQTPERSNESRTALTGSDQGLVWRRIFGDRDIYTLFYAACSLDVSNPDLRLSKTQKSLAQARLLSWLPKVASLDWIMVTRSHHPDVEASYGLKPTDKGLLQFASCNMVDYKGDVLLHMSLINFYADLLEHVRKTAPNGRGQSVALEFLIATGLHARSLSFYLQPGNPSHDPVDVSYLYGVSARYCSTYATSLPDHFLRSNSLQATLAELSRALDISPNKWAHGDSPKDDLHVLASIPRKALFAHTNGIPAWTSSPLSRIPSSQTNADALNTLATVFHGPPERKALKFPPDSPLSNDVDPPTENEAAAARALFYLYLSHHPKLFADVVSHAETIALKDKALAAINLISAVITAEWAPFPGEDGSFPTESQLNAMMPQPALAAANTGVLAVLSPPCLEYVLPYLLQPAQSFTNLVGGRGDTESTAYIIATSKFDALRALQSRLRELYQRERLPEFEQMLDVIDKRVREGPWSREGEVGGRIGTLEI
ncbi:hypothetical protein EV356DRAFT_191449 [Viridothelium virens]|uniref:DNA mismatch repair protein HSM3 N-terminal domain-containing protein n=1 Tax=Viridothelium virens TaxID=1048519 RepID=A0A6A6H880_VIRVR|nr:hypothetical protein EV356DRAFT_191449 [Viridothelium virens]